MAPRKRKAEEEEEKPETMTKRVTRSSARSAVATTTAESNKPKNQKLKAKPETSKKRKAEQAQEASKNKLRKSTTPEAKGKGKAVAEDEVITADGAGSHNNKTIVIEHCTQCTQFKKRALLVKDALEKSVSGITVLLNPEKPRRGCFEIREQGKTFISLLDMKRPFKRMKDLNMEEVIADLIDKTK